MTTEVKKKNQWWNPFVDSTEEVEDKDVVLNAKTKEGDNIVMKESDFTRAQQTGIVQVSEKTQKYFQELMEGLNIPGPDYFEFKKAINSLSSLSEETAFMSTFSTFNVMGVSREKLISSIDTYISAIKEDEENFEKNTQVKINQDVTSKLDLVSVNNKKIEELQKQVDQLKKQNEDLVSQTDISKSSINNTIQEYKKASLNLIEVLQKDKEKINTYIK